MNTALARARAFAIDLYQRLPQRLWLRIVVVLGAIPLLVLLYVLALIPLTPSIGDIRKTKAEQPALVLTADGKELAMFKRANRDWVKLEDISPNVITALIATEDHRFYDHHGMDFKRTAGAAISTFSGDREGGSTLTQQLARNLYPEEIGRAPTVTRKIKEAITALKIEAVYSKKEILETYLNTVPFLYNAFGIEMAARTYFDKSADKLDVLESATLVGMLKGTSYYNPVLNPERATQRRNIVLAQMHKHAKLDKVQYDSLKKKPLRVDFERQNEPLGPAPHLSQQLKRWLIEWADRKGYNIYTDGLVVRTTLDSRLQALANQAVTGQMKTLQALADGRRNAWTRELGLEFLRESPQYKEALASGLTEEQAVKQLQADSAFMQALKDSKTRLQAGFLALDPRTGQVRAWVGSRDFAQDQFDHVAQARRQPGSTFKPFVYGAAFGAGARATDTLIDQAVSIPIDKGVVWRPSDGEPPSGRGMTLREGLAYSKNTITAQVMQRVGPQRVADLARAMGVRQSKLDPVMSLALGTSPVTLKEMVASYGTIANGGSYIEPMVVTRIEDQSGTVLEDFQPAQAEPALSGPAALTLLDAMRGTVDIGTGMAVRARYGIKADVAGKTGTTQDNTDGWFMLMYPQLVAGSWVGFNDNRITMGDSWGQGARSALPIVAEVYQQAFKTGVLDPKLRFSAPPAADEGMLGRMNGWWQGLFEPPREPAPVAPPAELLPEVAQQDMMQPRPATGTATAESPIPQEFPRNEVVRVMPADRGPASSPGSYEILNPENRNAPRVDRPERPMERADRPVRIERYDPPPPLGASPMNPAAAGQANGGATVTGGGSNPIVILRPQDRRDERREERRDATESVPMQAARGSPSVRFEPAPDGALEPLPSSR